MLNTAKLKNRQKSSLPLSIFKVRFFSLSIVITNKNNYSYEVRRGGVDGDRAGTETYHVYLFVYVCEAFHIHLYSILIFETSNLHKNSKLR